MPIFTDPLVAPPAPPATVTSPDGILTVVADPDHAGVLLKADFSAVPDVYQIDFYRGAELVRSGDPSWAPGGLGVAYDHEAPLNATSTWHAVPRLWDGTIGAASEDAAMFLPEMDAAVDCWIKPLADPGLSVAFQIHTDRITRGYTGRVNTTAIPGRRLPSVTWDRRTLAPLSITLRTDTVSDRDALDAALDEGPVLVQLRSTYGISDFYAAPVDSTESYFLGMFSSLRDYPVTFQPCGRPATIDAPLFIPGRSYADSAAVAYTYDDRLTTWPTYLDVLFGTFPDAPEIPPETGGGDDEGTP
jgi:hypothetical protein